MDRTQEQLDAIEAAVIRSSADRYGEQVAAVMRRHKATLKRIKKMEQNGEWDRLRVLMRTSHLLEDLADAMAHAGRAAAEDIRQAMDDIREVMADDDGG